MAIGWKLCRSTRSMNERIRVLYIMGTARSGSTILEILLAHGEHCVGAGELTAIVQDGFIENKPCSCGASFDQCAFWSNVKKKLALPAEALREWAGLQHKVEWHTGFLRQCFGLLSAREWERYTAYNRKLLQALHEISGAAIIVDSSKYAGRALALSKMPGIDLSVICLTRSPEGLMSSFQKPNKEEQRPKNPWAVFRYYVFVMISLRMALKRLGGRTARLRFEDLIADPVAATSETGEKGEVIVDDVVGKLNRNEGFEVGHLITGNRLRKNKKVQFDRQPVETFSQRNAVLPLKLMKITESLVEL